jgi:hypothetical protein
VCDARLLATGVSLVASAALVISLVSQQCREVDVVAVSRTRVGR